MLSFRGARQREPGIQKRGPDGLLDSGSPLRGVRNDVVTIAGAALIADPSGALYWPEHGVLAVADLHLEKGSSYAARGQLLPPYDTAATLARLARLIAH